MSALIPVFVTDNFDQWRQKTNAIVDRANNIQSTPDVFSLQDPINDQDILVYDLAQDKFVNTGIGALVTEILTQIQPQVQSNLKPYYYAGLNVCF